MLMANSKTSETPFCSFAEHSTYLAFILFATASPCSGVTGVRPCVRRSSMQARLVRRSDLRPTRIRGVVGQKWRTSGYHWSMSVASLSNRLALVPCPSHFQGSWGSQWRNKRTEDLFLDMIAVSIDHTLLGQQCPTTRVRLIC